MDGGLSQPPPPRDRSRGPSSYPRAPSRSSTSTLNTRATPQSQSASSSTSHLVTSPQLTAAALHRHHHSSLTTAPNRKPGSPRPGPPMLARTETTGSLESRSTAASSYLQEKLQRERKVEGERAGRLMTMDLSASASMEMRTSQSSPVRSAKSDERRPRSSGNSVGGSTNGESKKKGMGVKEMEQTVSTLHKQNFDLKLELFHRRERQSALEERLETLESEKGQLEQMNDKLLEEMEKRDKAVEEAVAMIVLLEAQVENLLKERDHVRQLDFDAFYAARIEHATPKLKGAELARYDDDRVINRMPSFLSERSETTENLRNVYLGVRGSLLSLPRLSEGLDSDRDHPNNLTSPSLSVLSESSFLSVYGQKPGEEGVFTPQLDDSPGPNVESSPPVEARPVTRSNSTRRTNHSKSGSSINAGVEPETELNPRDRIVTPSRMPRSGSVSRAAAGPGQFQSITDILDHGSPLQRLERLDRTFSLRTDTSRTSGPEKDRTMSLRTEGSKGSGRDRERERERDAEAAASRQGYLQSQRKTKEEKREALRRVTTDGPTMRLDQGLPPTPDTISTSTLRHYQNSKDTLSNDGVSNQRSFLALSEATTADHPPNEGPVSQPPSMTAFNSRKEFPGSYFDRPSVLHQRPRSAGETTTSHRGRNEWDTDSDFEDEIHSVASTDDIWLREGASGPHRGTLGRSQGGRQSPDLFSFPGGSAGWNTGDLFGYGGRGFASSPLTPTGSYPLPAANAALMDDLLPVQQALFATSAGPPPPPNRRSSLHARTGSSSASGALATPRVPPAQLQQPSLPTSNGKLQKSPERRKGHCRRNSDDAGNGLRPGSQSSQQQRQQTPQPEGKRGQKDNHYPPIANQAPRGRGLNSLFRRSLGSSSGTNNQATATESAPASATEPTFAAAAATAGPKGGAIGVPSWVHRSSALDDDRASATPPPIMRNRVPGRKGSFDGDTGGVSLVQGQQAQQGHPPPTPVTPSAPNAAPMPTTPTTNAPPGGQQNSGASLTKRKWLPGFGLRGRRNSNGNGAANVSAG